jgi:hypothetical protein
MTLDEVLRQAKSDHESIRIHDKAQFIFQLEQKLAQTSRKSKRTWSLALSAFVIVPLFGTVAGAAVYKWTTTWNNKFHATNEGATDAVIAYIPPFWTPDYLNSLPQKSISIVDLQTSRTEAGFPIREPQGVSGWNKVFSNGYVEAKTMPLKYLDVYQNAHGERVAVLQQKSGDLHQPQQGILEYPQNAQTLTNFSPDLAVFLSGVVADKSRTKANELDIYHKNSDDTVTEFRIAGTVSEQTLEMFARAYIQAPTN